jgi:hypothetical protein
LQLLVRTNQLGEFHQFRLMIPAPAQGAMLVVAMGNDNLRWMRHTNDIERNSNLYRTSFLKTLKVVARANWCFGTL